MSLMRPMIGEARQRVNFLTDTRIRNAEVSLQSNSRSIGENPLETTALHRDSFVYSGLLPKTGGWCRIQL